MSSGELPKINESYPKELKKVVTLIRLAIFLGIPNAVIGFIVSKKLQDAWKSAPELVFIILAFTTTILFFISHKILKKRNWARIMYLIMLLLGLFTMGETVKNVSENFLWGLIQIAQIILQFYAAYLLAFDKNTKLHFMKGSDDQSPQNEERQSLSSELMQISDLHKTGSLTDQEFTEAKEKLLKRAA